MTELYIKTHFEVTAIVNDQLENWVVQAGCPDIYVHCSAIERMLLDFDAQERQGVQHIFVERPYISLTGRDTDSERVKKIIVSQRKFGVIIYTLKQLFKHAEIKELSSGVVRQGLFPDEGVSKDRLLSLSRYAFDSYGNYSVLGELCLGDAYLMYLYNTKETQ